MVATPGASRLLVGLTLLYADSTLRRYLSGPVPSACSLETTNRLALRALATAAVVVFEEDVGCWPPPRDWSRVQCMSRALGVGLSCAVATTPPRRGTDRVYCSVTGFCHGQVVCCNMAKRGRKEEMEVVGTVMTRAFNAAVEAMGEKAAESHKTGDTHDTKKNDAGATEKDDFRAFPADLEATMRQQTSADVYFHARQTIWNAFQRQQFQEDPSSYVGHDRNLSRRFCSSLVCLRGGAGGRWGRRMLISMSCRAVLIRCMKVIWR